MGNMKTKFTDWKNRLKDRHMLSIVSVIIILLIVIAALGIYTYTKQEEYKEASNNSYNMAFYELVNYMEDVETYLAKSTITGSSEHGAETLTNVWSKANLAEVYLSQIPINTEGLSNAQKFLNQLSDYSYTLAMKTIKGENLSDKELENLEQLHEYSVSLKDTLNQLANEINDGTISFRRTYKGRNYSICTAS